MFHLHISLPLLVLSRRNSFSYLLRDPKSGGKHNGSEEGGKVFMDELKQKLDLHFRLLRCQRARASWVLGKGGLYLLAPIQISVKFVFRS